MFVPVIPISVSRKLLAGCCGLLLTVSPLAHAQQKALPAPVAQESNIDLARYLVGPDDVLSVTVLKHPDFSAETVVVPSGGSIQLPVVGSVRAAGRTLTQLDQEITQRLRARLVRPEVLVTLVKPRPLPLYVLGQVRSPGVVEFKNGWRITQALAAAGGFTGAPERILVSVTRGKEKITDVSLAALFNEPNGPQNLALQVHDVLRFYEQVLNVQVYGAVAKPGTYEVPMGGSVVEAIGLAGGTLETASLTRASLRRAGGKEQVVDLNKVLRFGDKEQDVKLAPGDVIFVPQFSDKVSVLGAVRTSGFYGVEDGRVTTVSEVIARAGGPLESAALTRAIIRRGGQELPVNLYRVLVLGEKSGDIAVQKDDVISVPAARGVTVIGEVQKPGTYKLEEGANPRVSDALAMAGGLTAKPENVRINLARITGEKQTSMSINPVGLLELVDLSQNGRVADGDIISVSAIKKLTVSLSGEVKNAGAYELSEGDNVADLIARAGGTKDEAALTRVSLTRRTGEILTVNLLGALRDGGAKIDVSLQSGDLVVVPRNENRVLVLGAFYRPGSYAIPENRSFTVGDAISAAGGSRSLAKVKSIALMRKTAKDYDRQLLSMDSAKGGDLAMNIPIQPGDLIFLPEGKVTRSIWDQALQAVSIAGNLAG